jgi:hypothetical protein
MDNTINYTIDGVQYSMNIEGSPPFFYGEPELLSNADSDITFGTDWYEDGYTTLPFLDAGDFAALRREISDVVEKIIASLGIKTEGFQIEKYHRFINDDSKHLAVVSRTRDLFPEDFSLAINDVIAKIERVTSFELTDINPNTSDRMHIIVRINRPRSTDFNPPHKDSYEDRLARFVNFWIPICGVTQKSSLPLVPRSHLIPEDKILRTFEGGVVAGKRYRVRNIAEWNGRHDLCRAEVKYGQILTFSCHLIHGVAINDQDDVTRVALEFRLFERPRP